MANLVYNSFKQGLLAGSFNLTATNAIKVALVTSGYTPSIDNDSLFTDVTDEVTGIGYSAGGKALSNVTITQNNTTDLGYLDADDVTWTTSSLTARAAVLYQVSDGKLICYIDFGSDKISQIGSFTIQWNTSGIINLI